MSDETEIISCLARMRAALLQTHPENPVNCCSDTLKRALELEILQARMLDQLNTLKEKILDFVDQCKDQNTCLPGEVDDVLDLLGEPPIKRCQCCQNTDGTHSMNCQNSKVGYMGNVNGLGCDPDCP